ncbi:hypothetical protein I2I05_18825 [Hymenobacter sp. BT683]|uniref:Phage holin family protein n=1 Tax=Hymenobacter jeongseonensis TaxID=2791027 RepID=A0ABS0IM56_9BACT|nr:hypothetical protein [Hymenobacter jeongseonensis]MBF9239454.1 hypothetical protein [Hymenobacter jeongseonensis]
MLGARFLNLEIGAVVLAGLSSFVEMHIWSPAYTYYLLLVLVVLDVVTNNLVAGKPLVPRNLLLRLVAYTVLLGLAHGFAAHEPGLFFLSQLAMAPFVIVHMRSLIISFGKLGLVDEAVADLLQKRITRAVEAEPPLPEPPAAPAEVPTHGE